MARVSALLCALALSLSPAMGAAQDEQGKSLMERGAEMFLDGLRQEMEPKFEELSFGEERPLSFKAEFEAAHAS